MDKITSTSRCLYESYRLKFCFWDAVPLLMKFGALLPTDWLPLPWVTTVDCDVIISVMASQITSNSIVCLAVCSGVHQRNRQSSALLAFVRGIRWIPLTKPSNAENVSIWWRHHVWTVCHRKGVSVYIEGTAWGRLFFFHINSYWWKIVCCQILTLSVMLWIEQCTIQYRHELI